MPVVIVPLETAVSGGALAALPPQALAEFCRDFSPPAGRLLVAYAPAGSGIIGCAAFRRFDPSTCEVRRLVVNWDQQRRGLGRRLLAALAAEASRAGYARMVTHVPEAVPALVSFYGRIGFARSAAAAGQIRFELALPALSPAVAGRDPKSA